MKDKELKIKQKIKNMKNFYLKVDQLMDNLPDAIPKEVKEIIQSKILGDKELKDMMGSIDNQRPPRLFLIGRTGVGKSSLVNALFGTYVAKVSDTKSCTNMTQSYTCNGLEILDTRGIAESEELDKELSAEKALMKEFDEFSPDVVIFMLNCTHRDDVADDVEFLEKAAKEYYEQNKIRLPIVVVINKCDEMASSRQKEPHNYSQSKINKIDEVVKQYKGIIVKHGLKIDNIIGVSSYIEWQTPDGVEVDVENIENLPQYDIDNIQIAFDGRYKIEELMDLLEEAILDLPAKMGFRMAVRLKEVAKKFANHLIKIFTAISGTVAATPIPVSDIYILFAIQSTLVVLIATLGGRDLSLDIAKEFILSLGGIAGVGFVFRTVAQQAVKLANFIVPVSGSAISAGIAMAGTYSMGVAAISYYIDDKTLEEAKKDFEKEQEQ